MLLGQNNIISIGDTQSDRYWQHLKDVQPSFDSHYFSNQWLESASAVIGSAAAGRGNTQILSLEGQELVLRHYRRGGYISKVSEDRYLWTGLDSARPFHELAILAHLFELKLPVPRPYAAEVVRNGASYSGSLLTYRLPGLTLAEAFVQNKMTPDLWHRIGASVRLFHKQGICHADLNAHNILIRTELPTIDETTVAILDFDRAAIKDPAQNDWQHKVLTRLQRSLLKIAAKHKLGLLEIEWQTVLDGAHDKARVV